MDDKDFYKKVFISKIVIVACLVLNIYIIMTR